MNNFCSKEWFIDLCKKSLKESNLYPNKFCVIVVGVGSGYSGNKITCTCPDGKIITTTIPPEGYAVFKPNTLGSNTIALYDTNNTVVKTTTTTTSLWCETYRITL